MSPNVITAADVLALDNRRVAATLAGDTAALAELFADNLLYSHSNGSIDTKESFITKLDSGEMKYRGITRHDHQIAVYPHAAIISCRVTLEVTMAGTERTVNARATLTWVEQANGTWQFAAWQSCPVPA
jgi:ketosteroid isomerase-like protein